MDKKIKKIGKDVKKDAKKVGKEIKSLAREDHERDKTCAYGKKMMEKKKK